LSGPCVFEEEELQTRTDEGEGKNAKKTTKGEEEIRIAHLLTKR